MSTLSTSSRKVSVTLPKLYDWQKDTLDLIEANPGKWFIIKSVRQKSGKTYLLENLLIKTALEKPGSKSFMISPTNAQNLRIFTEISRATIDLLRKANGSSMLIEFRNGSVIQFRSGESGDSLRGYTVKRGGILAIDEGAFLSREVYEIVMPLVSKEGCTLVVASTPDSMDGMYYSLWSREDGVIRINWSDYINQMYSKEELDFYRSVYSDRRFRTEILGEFAVGEGTVFSGIANCVSPVELIQKGNLVAGIDFGSGNLQDSTVITFIDEDLQVIAQYDTNDKPPMEQIDWLTRLLLDYRPARVLAEKNGLGSVYFDALKQKCPIVTPWITTNDSKTAIVDDLAAHIEKGRIKFQPQCEKLLEQLQVYKETQSSTGKRVFNAPPGKHDDFVISTALALRARKSGRYSIG